MISHPKIFASFSGTIGITNVPRIMLEPIIRPNNVASIQDINVIIFEATRELSIGGVSMLYGFILS